MALHSQRVIPWRLIQALMKPPSLLVGRGVAKVGVGFYLLLRHRWTSSAMHSVHILKDKLALSVSSLWGSDHYWGVYTGRGVQGGRGRAAGVMNKLCSHKIRAG